MDFQAKLKAVYWRQSKIAPLIEGLEEEIPQQTLDDYYVKLNIIIKQDDDKKQGNYEKISGKKQEVEIANIFDQITNKTEPHRLLILGGAGVGKSTLMQYMAYKWSRGDLWAEKFDYVYRITLKTLLNDEWKENYEVKDRKADTLKCLAHYHLATGGESPQKIKLEEMVWLENKEKVLLLLDGYDEVAHERDGVYKDVFTKIFQHENLILTSRPNAIHKEMAEKFGREIENTGLDHDGINQYLTQYFKNDKEKGAELQEFLRKNSSIKDICRIPVNIAMMCFIWSKGEANETAQKISNVSDLYSQVVHQLGFRYDTKQNPQNRDELISKWRGGDIYLDELQVLQHVAFKGMIGGGFEVPEEKRTETLIIKGMTKKDDKDGISIQSSILYLQENLKRDMPAINKIYQYGLLKLDGSIGKGQNKASAMNKKEPSDTDLLAQNFNFIHLSFQEFLTASYFVKKLLKEDIKEQEKVGNFIAHHRNEQRYLMTLKFMAGILSSCEEDEANEKINIFWDAVLCNPDGVLELGVEAKVTLLMHLIGQTKNETRVPNMSVAVDLIDSGVLEDISGWSTQIKESDYLSENMKEGLIEYFLKDNLEWLGKKCHEIKIKFASESKKNLKETLLNIEEIIEIIVSMLHKFSKEQQIQIFQKLFRILQAENNQKNWQLLKKAIEGIVAIQEKVEINLNSIEKRKVLDALKKTVHDSNLAKVSLIAIQQVLNETDDALFLEVIKGMIEETPNDVNNVGVYQTVLGGVVQIAQRHHENQMLKSIVNILVPLLGDSKSFVRENIATTIAELIGSIGITEKELVKEIIGAYISLWQSLPKEKGFVQTNIVKLAKINNEFVYEIIKDLDSALRNCSEAKIKKKIVDTMMEVIKIGNPSDPQFCRDIIANFLIPLLNEGDDEICNLVSSEIPQVVRVYDGNDPQLARDIIQILLPLLQEKRDTTVNIIYDLAIIRDAKDEQFIRNIIKILLKDEQQELKLSISERIVELIKACDIKDPQFIKDVISNLSPSLKSTSDTTRLFEAEKIVWLMERGGITDIQLVIDITNLAALVSPDIQMEYLIRTAKVVAEVIRVAKITNEQLAKDIIRSVTGCFKNWSVDAKCVLINSLFGLMKMKGIISDTQYVKDSIMLASYFESFNDMAYKDLGEILVLSGSIKDTQFVGGLLNSLIPLMEKNQLTSEVMPSFEEFVKKLNEECEIELAREILKVLAKILTFSTIKFHSSAERLMIEIAKKRAASNPNFLQDVMIALAPVFENPDESILRFGLNITQEILRINGTTNNKKFVQECISVLTPIFKTSATEAKLFALQIIENLIKNRNSLDDDQIIKNLIEALIANLGDKNEDLRSLVSKTILNLVKTPQLAVHAINSSVILRDTSQIASFLTGLVQIKGVVNLELIQESISGLAPLMQLPQLDVKFSASKIILELVKISQKEKDEKFCKMIIPKLLPSLQDPDENTQLLSLDLISKIVEVNDSEGLAKHVVPEFASLLSGDSEQLIQISGLEKIVIFSKKGGSEFGQGVLKNSLIPLLQISEEENWRSLVLKNIGDLAKAIGKINVEIAKSVIPILFSLLKNPNYSILSSTAITLADLIKACHPTDIQFIRSLVNDLVSLLKETSGDDAKCCLLDSLAMLAKTIETSADLDFIREIIVDILVPYLHDDDLRSNAASWIPDFVGIAVKSDLQFTREIIKILLPLLSDAKVKQSVSGAISKILIKYDAKDEQFTKEVLDSLFVYLKDEKHMLDIRTSSSIIEVIKTSDIKDPQFIQDVIANLAPSLKSPDDTTRFIEAEKIVWLMERGGIRRAQLVKDIVNIAVLVPPSIHAEYLIRTATVVAEAIKIAKITDAELAKDVIKNVTDCLKEWFDDARCILLDPIIELVKIKSVIVDTHFVKEYIETLVALSGNFNQKKLMSTTIKNIVDLLKITDLMSETEFVTTTIDTIFSFLQGRQEAVQEVMELFVHENKIELIQSIFNNMFKLLSDCKQEEMGCILSNCIILIAQKYPFHCKRSLLKNSLKMLQTEQFEENILVFTVL